MRIEELKKLYEEIRKRFTPEEISLLLHEFTIYREEDIISMGEITSKVIVEAPESYKPVEEYPNSEKIKLPEPKKVKVSIDDVIMKRRSVREYSNTPLSLEDLSTLLNYSYGISTNIKAYGISEFPLRTIPTTGGLSAPELYVVVNNVKGLSKGLYHWYPPANSLELLFVGNLVGKIYEIGMRANSYAANAPVVFFITIALNKGIWKYGHMFYLYGLVDVGCLLQNIYLVATALGLGACGIAGFDKIKAAKMIGCDPLQVPVLMVSVGYPSRCEQCARPGVTSQ
ncbi:MAG: SagB/ThcOx family dehydrogenase [Thermosphaera sp.]|nr:SagB/ThcOx family dehydrogenase [Thermosphaera sp.]